MNGFEQVEPHIFVLREENVDFLPGWYYSNEVDQIKDGPFSTIEEARHCLEVYTNNL